jgi:hypothetical protein
MAKSQHLGKLGPREIMERVEENALEIPDFTSGDQNAESPGAYLQLGGFE